jgi:hypothetical protein
MSRLAIASIATTLVSAMPANAEEPIALRDMSLFYTGSVSDKPDKQAIFMGGVPFHVDPSGGTAVEQMYILPQDEMEAFPLRQSNVIGVTSDGSQIFCFCGGISF